MGVTRFSSQVKPTNTTSKWAEFVIPWQVMCQRFTTANAAVVATCLGTGNPGGGKVEIGSSGLTGLCPASTDEIDFLLKIPRDMDVTAASYLDIYYLTGPDTGVTANDEVAWAITYKTHTPSATSDNTMGDATTTTGITNPTRRTLASTECANRVWKDSATIAASTFTLNDLNHIQITAATSCSEFEVAITHAALRYVKDFA